jgi:hypothetical protein
MKRSRTLRRATLAALIGTVAAVLPVHAQRGGGRGRAAADTAGAGGAPSLRVLLARGDSDLRVVRQRFEADRAALGRRYDIPLSPVLHARLRTFYEGWQMRLAELNVTGLNPAGKADVAALHSRIRAGLDTVAAEERQFLELAPLLPFARTIQRLQEQRRDRLDVDPMEAARILNDVAKDVVRRTAAIRGAAAGGAPAELRSVTAETAARAVRFLGATAAAEDAPARARFGASPGAPTLKATLDSWYSFYFGYDPLFTWWVRKPFEELTAALEAYSRAIERQWADRAARPAGHDDGRGRKE